MGTHPGKNGWRGLARLQAGAALLCSFTLTQAAGVTPRDIVMPPALSDGLTCSQVSWMLAEKFYERLNVPYQDGKVHYSVQQARAMVTGLDELIIPMCRALNTEMAPTQRLTLGFLDTDEDWKRLLADPKGAAWLRENSTFLAEIEPVYVLYFTANRLTPDPTQVKKLRPSDDEIFDLRTAEILSFTREEAETRAQLADPAKRARLAALLPARFDIARLARMEEKTRLAGLPFLERYLMRLGGHKMDEKTTLREPTKAEMQASDAADNIANSRIDALVKQYGLPKSSRQ